jgi:SAM-dependent methyltransferase
MIAAQQPFDILAETYDKDFSHTLIGKLQREKVWSKLLPLLNSYNRPLHILELNCGTGEDALQLASLGHHVIATDASAVMIEKAKQKTMSPNSINERLQFIQCSFEKIDGYNFNTKFDVVFSNFGGLNCIDAKALQQLAASLSKYTHAESHLFFVVMGSFCAWETGYYLLRGKFKTAFRRWRKQVEFRVNSKSMNIYYYTPASFKKLFRPAFNYINSFAIGLFIPPSYLEPFFVKHPALLKRMNMLENKFAKPAFMRRLSDHYCIVLKKM